MDVEQARTFIAVMETRSFIHAAEQLFVTQSTVSARIKALEERLGCRLFNRNKAGVSLTAAGIQFSRHAMTFIRAWGQARQEVALPESYTARINIGAQISHWDDLMVNWMCWLRESHPHLAVRAEIGSNDSLMRQIVDGLLDFAVIYTPHAGPGLRIEKLFEEEIMLVGTRRYPRPAKDKAPAWERDYVFVDWGAEFRNEHALAWPDLATPAVHFGVGTVALEFILRTGGVAYLPLRIVRRHLKERRLFRVPDAPIFKRPVFLVMTSDPVDPPLKDVLDGLRWIAVSTQLGEEPDGGAAKHLPPPVKASA
jgi:DNA-binding transcriptional LysR family regulator